MYIAMIEDAYFIPTTLNNESRSVAVLVYRELKPILLRNAREVRQVHKRL